MVAPATGSFYSSPEAGSHGMEGNMTRTGEAPIMSGRILRPLPL